MATVWKRRLRRRILWSVHSTTRRYGDPASDLHLPRAMLILAAYSLESKVLSPDAVLERTERLRELERDWLLKKGVASNPDEISGTFKSRTEGSFGSYSREIIEAAEERASELVLTEDSRSGLLFTTRFSWIASASRVVVFVSLSVENAHAVIAPIFTDPRCPSIVRTLLREYDDWTIGGTPLSPGSAALSLGRVGGELLAETIRNPARAVPLVVVSRNEGETTWADCAQRLAHELAGLSNVVEIDEEAAWRLTAILGKRDACYSGAVRLYWPSRGFPRLTGTVWTASALLSGDVDGGGLNRFSAALRRRVMSTAALTLSAPASFRRLQSAIARSRLNELERRNAGNAEELEIARMYLADNETLKKEKGDLEAKVRSLLARAEAAEAALNASKEPEEDDSPHAPDVDEPCAPVAGESRFYKKTHSKPGYDVLVRVADCRHNAWQSAAKADKAKKGIERVEGSNDWKNVQHCGSCTGGGMWKVRW